MLYFLRLRLTEINGIWEVTLYNLAVNALMIES
jgi:hypothetical protein